MQQRRRRQAVRLNWITYSNIFFIWGYQDTGVEKCPSAQL